MDAERDNHIKSNQEYDWTYPIQPPEGPANNFEHPNEYNSNPKIEYNVPDKNLYKPDSNKYKPVPKFQYPHEYKPTSSNINHNIPDTHLYKPDSNQHNPDPTIEYPNQYNPTAPSIPDTNQYKPDSNQHNPVAQIQYPNEYNPTHPTPKIPKINPNIWGGTRKRPNSRRPRPYRQPSRIRRPRPCKPSIWGYYYGSHGKLH